MPLAKLRVLLAQLPVPSSPALNTPLAAGYLNAYAEARGLGSRARIAILPRALADRAGDAALVEAIVARRPDLLGLSLYTWNSERSLALALRVKARLPGLIVVAGGPEVQPDNAWLLQHPALDLAVIGEGEQTFAELVELLAEARLAAHTSRHTPRDPQLESRGLGSPVSGLAVACLLSHIPRLTSIPGLAIRSAGGQILYGPERAPLDDLSVVPSPYLAGCLELSTDGMLMVEVSRWCPYSCSFCLYGRKMGVRLGGRSFGLERVLAEVAWGRERGVRRVHFVEANLNLVPIFWPLMRALAELNADRRLTFYAELRGEHLGDAVVAALDAANVRVVEVGLQTANPAALRASYRRTDLAKWAAGTRRLYARQITVLLDVILGLPADDAAGVAETLRFLEREGLGPYDVFTLQVLPGTAVRREGPRYGLMYQDLPPYYVLATDRFSFTELRQLRQRLKAGLGLDPGADEGLPPPRPDALDGALAHGPERETRSDLRELRELRGKTTRLGLHVDIIVPIGLLAPLTPVLREWLEANPTTVFDLYLLADEAPPEPATLQAWREALPFVPGYLDRAAVYRAQSPEAAFSRASPRLFLVLPWVAQAEPADYEGIAQIIWRYDAAPGETLPLGAWRAVDGGIWLRLDLDTPPAVPFGDASNISEADAQRLRAALLGEARAWAADSGRLLWCAEA